VFFFYFFHEKNPQSILILHPRRRAVPGDDPFWKTGGFLNIQPRQKN
jgi:hypothetical protein